MPSTTIAGGLVGIGGGVIANSYSRSDVTVSASKISAGGLIGEIYCSNTILDNYWDTQTSGQTTGVGGRRFTRKTTAQMRDQDTFVGRDFTSMNPVWKMPPSIAVNDGYPQLWWE